MLLQCLILNLLLTSSRSRYHSIRIDAVHYCPLEEILSEERKRKRFSKNHDPENVPLTRLELFRRTLQEGGGHLRQKVQFIKLTSTMRDGEACEIELAKAVANLYNLKYVDLPQALYRDSPSCAALKEGLKQCKELRKMGYMRGGERSFAQLAIVTDKDRLVWNDVAKKMEPNIVDDELTGERKPEKEFMLWHTLEVLDLSGLEIDPTILREVLAKRANYLVALKIDGMKYLQDNAFDANPRLRKLVLIDTPQLTVAGLTNYLSHPGASSALESLTLKNTGIRPSDLHQILSAAPSINFLSINETVSSIFPSHPVTPLLCSHTLKTMHYEITSASSADPYNTIASSYYTYLASSLLSHCLPHLSSLYVFDPKFPEMLIDLAPPMPNFAGDAHLDPSYGTPPARRFSSNNPFASSVSSSTNPFNSSVSTTRSAHSMYGPSSLRRFSDSSANSLSQPLQIYSKGLEELEWNFSRVEPPSEPGRKGSFSESRPVSSYGLESGRLSPAWNTGGGARHSVIVGNGFGGLLAVPVGDDSPSGKGRRGSSSMDMWR